MAIQVAQFRYYGESITDEAGENFPSTLSAENLKNGNAFVEYMPIIQLGIQTLPGVKFYLNSTEDPIIIGNTGIYELELDNLVSISALRFDNSSLKMIQENDNAMIIIDILYGEED